MPVNLEHPEVSKLVEIAGDLRAKDVMQCGVISLERWEALSTAASLMVEKSISGLPVTNEGCLDGMLSDKDLLRSFYDTEYLPRLIEDYMTHTYVSFDIEDKFSDICQCLAKHSFRRVPILCEQRLAGMITRADLIRAFLKRNRAEVLANRGRELNELLAEDAMEHGIVTLSPGTTLTEAMSLVTIYRLTGVPVVNPGLDLLGIITEKDLLLAIGNPDVMSATVDSCMTRHVITFDRKSPLRDVCECLLKHDFRRVPIVDQNKLVGIISRSDLLKIRMKSFKLWET